MFASPDFEVIANEAAHATGDGTCMGLGIRHEFGRWNGITVRVNWADGPSPVRQLRQKLRATKTH